MAKETKRRLEKGADAMKMNFSRAQAIIKSQCPREWAVAHARSLPKTRERYGLRGVYVQVLAILREVEDWDDEYGAVAFLRQWAERHREEAELSA